MLHLMLCSFGGLPNSQIRTGPHCLPGLPANKRHSKYICQQSVGGSMHPRGHGTGDTCACGLSLSATSCWKLGGLLGVWHLRACWPPSDAPARQTSARVAGCFTFTRTNPNGRGACRGEEQGQSNTSRNSPPQSNAANAHERSVISISARSMRAGFVMSISAPCASISGWTTKRQHM